LSQRYGNDMVILQLYDILAMQSAGATGRYGPLTSHQIPPPPSDSYEYYFRGADMDKMFLDLRGIQPSSATNWIFGPRLFRSIGAVYEDDNPGRYFYSARLSQEFDVLIYFTKTLPSVLLSF
jgi:erythromycin esterase-like protein